MKRLATTVALFAAITAAHAATAFFTGRQEMVQTVTFQMAWKCEYNYNGRMFWQLHQGSCPSSVEVF